MVVQRRLIYNPFTNNFDYAETGGGPAPGEDLHVAKLIVNSVADAGGNFLTVPAAMTAASDGDTIFVMPGVNGVYNVGGMAWKAGVNICAFAADAMTPNVTLSGQIIATFEGFASMSGIHLSNETGACINMSGTANTRINLVNCRVDCSGTEFSILNSNPNAAVNLLWCRGDISGIKSWFNFSAGGINFVDSFFFNGVSSTQPSLISAGAVNITNTSFFSGITTSGTASIGGDHSIFITPDIPCITCNGAVSTNILNNCRLESLNATSLIIGAGSTIAVNNTSMQSGNTDVISGAGTLKYGPITFDGTSSGVTVGAMVPNKFGPEIAPIMTDTNGAVYYDGTVLKTSPPETAGYVYTSNGAGAAPTMQPAASGGGGFEAGFSAYQSAPTGNVTGDNTIVNIICDAELYDDGGNYDPITGLYTIPFDGLFIFSQTVAFLGGDINTSGYITLWDSNGYSIRAFQDSPTPFAGANTLIYSANIIAPYTAGQTIRVAALAGGITQNVAIYGSAPATIGVATAFSGGCLKKF